MEFYSVNRFPLTERTQNFYTDINLSVGQASSSSEMEATVLVSSASQCGNTASCATPCNATVTASMLIPEV